LVKQQFCTSGEKRNGRMNTFKRQFLLDLFKIVDLVMCLVAFVAAMVLSHLPLSLQGAEDLVAMRFSILNFAGMLVFLGVWHLIFRLTGLYDSKRISTITREFGDLLWGVMFCCAVFLIADFFFPLKLFNNRFVPVFGSVLFIILASSRVVLRLTLRELRKSGSNLRHVLIVGTDKEAMAFAEKILKRPDLGWNLKGFVDDQWRGGAPKEGRFRIVADFAGFKAYLRGNVIDEVIVCLPSYRNQDEMRLIVEACSEQGILVRSRIEHFRLEHAYTKIEYLDSDILLTYCTGHMRRRMLFVKKVYDYAGAFVLTVVLSPLLFLIALAIKLTSRGPVIFVQERLGFNKRRFRLYKFRTMVPGAEQQMDELEQYNEMGGAAFKIKNDPRMTPVGRVLRKFSLDELPQLWNVLKGDMSLVGPRPLPERDFHGFDTDWHRRRFSVKPGLTCLWQVSGRNRLTFDEWMALDLRYIDNWSPLLDAAILLKTVPAVFIGHGAS
jgi:exopolysaccharide biosynthesis polyprenyl glycosylphosphotransferase